MSDLISRSALDERIRNRVRQLANAYGWNDEYVNGFDESLVYVANAPAVDAVRVVHARWNHNGPDFPGGIDWYSCSACGNQDAAKWMKYCPACGAKMDGGASNA